jgi:hypothetical protein
VTTRGGKSTRDPPNPSNSNTIVWKQKDSQEEEPTASTQTQKDSKEKMAPLEYTDTMNLPFPTRTRKQAMNE